MRAKRIVTTKFRLASLALMAMLPWASFVRQASASSGEFIPTGKRITPTAATGSTFQPLNPELPGHPGFTAGQAVTTATSPDGKTLLILTSGYNSQNDAAGNSDPAQSNEYVFVYDISGGTPVKKQVLQVPNAFDGLAWNPSGTEFYVSGGPDDDVHVFDKSGAAFSELAGSPINLGHSHGLGLGSHTPTAAGLAVTADGSKLIVANWGNDSVSVIDIASRAKIGELDLRPGKINPAQSGVPGGEYPFWVSIKGNNKAYVSSIRDREVVVLNITSATPSVLSRISFKGKPNKMILNKAQTLLYAASDVTDTITVVDTASDKVSEEIPTTAPSSLFSNPKGFKGSSPNSLVLAPDERTLYVTNGGTNSVAVIRLAGGGGPSVAGLIPTGWYPNSASLNADGSMLYVVNGKGNAGPNPQNCTDEHAVATGDFGPCNAANQYVWQLTKAGFSAIPVPNNPELSSLTLQVAQNNGFQTMAGVNRVMQLLRTQIKHVIYVVKENRTYDQVLGDLEKGNGDPSIVVFPQPITPNHHQLASEFVTLDNFYDSGEVSGDGWNWTTQARTTDSVEKTVPVVYAGRGTFNYDYEGTNRNINTGYATVAERQAANPVSPSDPDLLPGTADVSGADSLDGEAGAGYIWNAAKKAGLTVRNYGFFIDLTRYSLPSNNSAFLPPTADDPNHGSALGSTVVAYPTKQALQSVTDPFFRGFDNKFPDFWRFKEWEREFDGFAEHGNLPSLEFVRIMHDHFGNFSTAVDGVNTFETQMADNDYALGLLVDKVAHSRFKDSTLIFVIEDDAQDGPDHVDPHRSIAYVIGPHVRQGKLVSARYTTVNMLRTIEDILGITPLNLNDGFEGPMTEVFENGHKNWTYDAFVPDVLRTTSLPLPTGVADAHQQPGIQLTDAKPRYDAARLEALTRGMDFSVEDHLDAGRFNRIIWTAMKGDSVPYPTKRDRRDLRHDRARLLKGGTSPRKQVRLTDKSDG